MRLSARVCTKVAMFLIMVSAIGFTSSNAQKVQLTWWWDSSPSTVEFARNELIPAFERLYPNISVEYVPITDKQDKIAAAFLGGVAPDIFGGWPEERIMLPERGMALPLDRYLASWKDAGDFFEGSWASMRYKGQTYGIPYYLDLRTIIYRKDFFDEAGIDSTQPPQTWDDLLRAAKKLTSYRLYTKRLALSQKPSGSPL
jgi:multiple sugar transport system substrate-binding protein